ncbi:transposase [Klebsiella michiganensis]|nr:transposase [Klebsiella michiganensis]SBL70815.1 transposase [Klebsiella michiganensis]
MRTNIEVARLCGFDQNSVNHPGILLWPIQRSFLLWMKLTYVVDRHLTTQMAAQRLGISAGQCRRLLSRYRESGPPGMANRRRGNPSNNQLPDGFTQYALNIIRDRYTDFGPTLAYVKLAELHDVHLSKETVRSLMVKAGLRIPRKQRAPKIQQPRYRRACCGELMQIDGCKQPSLVREPCTRLYRTGLRRRRDEPPDAASICKTGIDIHLF